MMVCLSASLVLYKPDLPTVERTLEALQISGNHAKSRLPVSLNLTLVDNSDDHAWFERISNWLAIIRSQIADWEVNLVRAPGNLGYGKGNNLVIENIDSKYHLVINPDLFVSENCLYEALHYMEERPDVGLISPAVFGMEGERQYLCKRNPTLFIMFLRSFAPSWIKGLFASTLNAFEMHDCDYEKEIYPLEYPTGCFMFFRSAELKKIGGFDPAIFLHYEDADIGRRILETAKVNYVPSIVVTHQWARDTHKSWSSKLHTIKSGWYYWRKWGGVFNSPQMREPAFVATNSPSKLGLSSEAGKDRLVLVTGAGGFIGKAVCAFLPNYGFNVLGIVRNLSSKMKVDVGVRYHEIGDINKKTDWSEMLVNIDSIVHLAARVHVLGNEDADSIEEYRQANVEATVNLALQAAAAGVRRFVFISSIKVNGENTPIGQPFRANSRPDPEGYYAISKYEAEEALMALARSSEMEIVIIRPPLVYGPGVKANFKIMLDWASKIIPLPVAAFDNRRSFLSINNLTEFIATCLHHPNAVDEIFLVSDGIDLSISELVRLIKKHLGMSWGLVWVPQWLIFLFVRAYSRAINTQSLFGVLQVDIRKNLNLLGWTPADDFEICLKETVLEYAAKQDNRVL